MDTSQPLPYLSRRLRILFVPWAFWFALYVVYLIPGDIAHHRLVVHSTASWLYRIRFDLWLAAFSSAFWFVPNLAVGMCILVLFRRHLRSLRLGVALFIVNFVYVANIYAEWFPPVHTTAVFAFVSFLWLGSFASGNFSRISRLMDRVPVVVVAVLTGLSYALCVVETKILVVRHSVDPFNTLRLSNQIFSILVVLLLLKIKTASWPSFINVREQTYAIYLIHTFFQRIGRSFMEHGLRPGFVEGAGPAMSFLLSSFSFIFGYGASWLMARWIANSDGWRWTIGLKPREIPGQNRKHQAMKTPDFRLGERSQDR
jgi:hypothetical protein